MPSVNDEPAVPALPLRTLDRWLLIILLLLGIAGIVSSYTALSETVDEGSHVYAGLLWWRDGTYTQDNSNPPLARIVESAPLYWLNIEPPKAAMPLAQRHHAYKSKIIAERLGILPFYILSCLMVFAWSRRLFGNGSALWSLSLYITLATVSAHAGIATTDMAYTTMFLAAVMSAIAWIKAPRIAESVALGLCIGLMAGAKFSALAHWPAAMIALLIAIYGTGNRLPFRLTDYALKIVLFVLPCAVFALGVLYHFDYGPLIDGIRRIAHLSHSGFAVWLFGPLNNHGVWYFFPVVFFFKTPLTFFAAVIAGHLYINRAQLQEKEGRRAPEYLFPLFAAMGVMVSSMFSNYNLGVRHVLPVYPLLCMPAGYGLKRLWDEGRAARALAALLLAVQAGGFAITYPDHISYFNILAGDHPEHISMDSDFDWSQGYVMLQKAIRQRDIRYIHICEQRWRQNAINARLLLSAGFSGCPYGEPMTGWVAVSRARKLFRPYHFQWLQGREPVQTVGGLFDLYYIPPGGA